MSFLDHNDPRQRLLYGDEPKDWNRVKEPIPLSMRNNTDPMYLDDDDERYGPPGNRRPGVVEYEARKAMEATGNNTLNGTTNSTAQSYVPNYPLPGNKTAADVIPSWIPNTARNKTIEASQTPATGNMSGMCEYTIPTGRIHCKDTNGQTTVNATGYAGNSYGRNNASAQNKTDVGPLPEGDWLIGPTENRPGNSNYRRLYPVPGKNSAFTDNTARNPWSFAWHGNNKENNASEGCIVSDPAPRTKPEDYPPIRVKPE